jgi:hypothetical protein
MFRGKAMAASPNLRTLRGKHGTAESGQNLPHAAQQTPAEPDPKALSLTISETLLATADEVIQ